MDKLNFFNRPSIKQLPKAEAERRWKQHQMSTPNQLVVASQAKPRTRQAPVSVFTERRVSFSVSQGPKDSLVVKGQDYLGPVTVPSAINGVSTPAGTAHYNILINPTSGAFSGTRLEKFAQMYDKFVFKKLRFHVQTSAPTDVAGSYLVAYDRDMADATPEEGESAIKAYFSMSGTRSQSAWEDATIDCPLTDTQKFFYTNYTGFEGRITAQGQFYLATLARFSSATVMNVWVEYEVLLMDPGLETFASFAQARTEKTETNIPNNALPLLIEDNKTYAGDITLRSTQLVNATRSSLLKQKGGASYILPAGWYEVIYGAYVAGSDDVPFAMGISTDSPKIVKYKDQLFGIGANTTNATTGSNYMEWSTSFTAGIPFTAYYRVILQVLDAYCEIAPWIQGNNSPNSVTNRFCSVMRLVNGRQNQFLTRF